jgi:hypothetical protein
LYRIGIKTVLEFTGREDVAPNWKILPPVWEADKRDAPVVRRRRK